MDASIIGLIFTALIVFFLLVSFIFGVKRGLKKSLFRLGWLIVTIVLLVFLTPVLSNIINKIDISSLNLDIMGPVNKFSDIGVNLINNITGSGDLITNSLP